MMAKKFQHSGWLVALAALAASGPASAAEWWLSSESKTLVTFADRETVRRQTVRGTTVMAVWLWEFELKGTSYVQTSKNLYLVDCAGQRMAMRAGTHLKANGDVEKIDNFEDYELEFSYMSPGSLGQSDIYFACNAEKGAGEVIEFSVSGKTYHYIADPEDFLLEVAKSADDETRPRTSPIPSVSAAQSPTRPAAAKSSGSAFFISSAGIALTNAHVVSGCSRIVSSRHGTLTVIATDEASDLALLKSPTSQSSSVSVRERAPRLAEPVTVAGFPLTDILGTGIRVTTGSVSALSGIGGDRTHFQLSASIQPGNSGGPVLDSAGQLIGVVTAKLDEVEVARSGGGIPQNVNFAVTSSVVLSFLQENGIEPSLGASQADPAQFTFLVRCMG